MLFLTISMTRRGCDRETGSPYSQYQAQPQQRQSHVECGDSRCERLHRCPRRMPTSEMGSNESKGHECVTRSTSISPNPMSPSHPLSALIPLSQRRLSRQPSQNFDSPVPFVNLLCLSLAPKHPAPTPNTRRTHHGLHHHPSQSGDPKPRMPRRDMCRAVNMLVDPHTSHTDRHGWYSCAQHDSLVDTESLSSDGRVGRWGL